MPSPEAEDGLVEYFRCIAGEHSDWDEYREAMRRQGKSLIRITIDGLGTDRHRRVPAGPRARLIRRRRCRGVTLRPWTPRTLARFVPPLPAAPDRVGPDLGVTVDARAVPLRRTLRHRDVVPGGAVVRRLPGRRASRRRTCVHRAHGRATPTCPARRSAPPASRSPATSPSTRPRPGSPARWRCSRRSTAGRRTTAPARGQPDRALRARTTTTRSGTAPSWCSATATGRSSTGSPSRSTCSATSSPTRSPSTPPGSSTATSPVRSTSRSPTSSPPASSSGCSGRPPPRPTG